MLALGLVYFAAARLGLSVARVTGSVSPIWPSSGLGLAALVLWGVSRWPGIFLGAWMAVGLTSHPTTAGLGIAAGSTLAPVLGALLLQWVGFSRDLRRVRDVVALCVGAGAFCFGVSALVGTSSLALAGSLPWAQFRHAAWVWWVGNLVGVVVVAPPLLLVKGWSPRWSRASALLVGRTVAFCVPIFLITLLGLSTSHAAAFLLFPPTACAALRFGPGGAAFSTLVVSSVAILGTAAGFGPFSSGNLVEDLLLLQLFVGITALTGLLLAATEWERRRAVEQLGLLAATVRGVHEGVLIAEVRSPGQLRTVFANEALCALLGYRGKELEGTDPWPLYASGSESEGDLKLEEALRVGAPFRAEVPLVRKDGSRVWSEVLLSPVRATGEEVTHVVVTHRDVSETKELQARLVAAERVAAVGTVAAGVGHEINNPLAYLALNLESAARSLTEDGLHGARDALASVHGALEGAERIRLIVKDLRVFSRQGDVERSLVDLNALVPPAVRIIAHALRHRARLVEEFGPVPRVLGSEARLGQVVLNLLVNAMQSIPEGSSTLHEVRVRTMTDASGRARVDVTDTGAGIPPHVLPRIFEPFFTTKPSGEGTGLGLAICLQIVRAHGGDLQVKSEPGRGSTFTVLLPAAPVQAQPLQRPSRSELPTVNPTARRGRVLVVDDEPRLAQSMRLLLEPYHDVVTTTRGSEALTMMDSGHRFDVILCDLQMPETDGMAVYQRMTERVPDQAERVVFISGGAYTQQARDFIGSVTNRVLEKPVRPEVLLAAVDAALGQDACPPRVEALAANGARH